jgi:cytosine/creatinine deaminase
MDEYLRAAMEEAEIGAKEGGIPIGSVLIYKNQIIGRGHNRRLQENSVILHAEMDALRDAGRKPAAVYRNCTLYTTLSPCPMCAGAIILYGIREVVIGENKNFMGEEDLLRSRGVRVRVLQDRTCIDLMAKFINASPEIWNEDIGV